jgi:hypothetical protein
LTFHADVKKYTLGDIATVTKLAGFEFTKYMTYSDEGSIIALRGLNVKNGKLDLRDVKYIDRSDLSKLTRSKLTACYSLLLCRIYQWRKFANLSYMCRRWKSRNVLSTSSTTLMPSVLT